MADDAASQTPPAGGSPLDDLEDDPLAGGDDPLGEDDPFGGEDPFGASAFGSEPPAVMMAKLWIRQNALLSVGVAFAAGTLIGALKK